MKKILALCMILFLAATLSAQIKIIDSGKSTGRIVVNQDNPIDMKAATLLKDLA